LWKCRRVLRGMEKKKNPGARGAVRKRQKSQGFGHKKPGQGPNCPRSGGEKDRGKKVKSLNPIKKETSFGKSDSLNLGSRGNGQMTGGRSRTQVGPGMAKGKGKCSKPKGFGESSDSPWWVGKTCAKAIRVKGGGEEPWERRQNRSCISPGVVSCDKAKKGPKKKKTCKKEPGLFQPKKHKIW